MYVPLMNPEGIQYSNKDIFHQICRSFPCYTHLGYLIIFCREDYLIKYLGIGSHYNFVFVEPLQGSGISSMIDTPDEIRGYSHLTPSGFKKLILFYFVYNWYEDNL